MFFDGDAKHPIGTIGVFTAELSRYPEFAISLEQLRVPIDMIRREPTHLIWARGVDLVRNQNNIVRGMRGEWLWILADDHEFAPDILLKLLGHSVDVVVPLVAGRRPPFKPVMCRGPIGAAHTRYQWGELPRSGLFQLPLGDLVGTAGMLIRRSVLDRLKEPWFECGQWDPEYVGEDLYLCKKMADIGVPIHVDCDQRMSHMVTCSVWPDPLGSQGVAIEIPGEAYSWRYVP